MASTEEEVVHRLNLCKLSNGDSALPHLQAVQDLLLQHHPDLLPRFLPEVLKLQVAPLGATRKWLAE